MSNKKTIPETAISVPAAMEQETAPALVKKIGRTAYEVSFHFSKTSTETMEDKIKHLIKREMNA